MNPIKNKVIVVIGATSTGKTAIGVEIAKRINGEIISADSRQIYRYLDIGTGKDLHEYSVNNEYVKYHLIDLCSPQHNKYSVKQFVVDAEILINDITRRGKVPIVVGGSMLYINALISGYAFNNCPQNYQFRELMKNKSIEEILKYTKEHLKIEKIFVDSFHNKHRIIRAIEKILWNENRQNNNQEHINVDNEWLILTPSFDRVDIYLMAIYRLYDRISRGLIDEIYKLNKYHGLDWDLIDSFGLEYRYVSKYVRREFIFCDMIEKLIAHIKKFIKTQELWMNNMVKNGLVINKIIHGDRNQIFELAYNFINSNIENEKITSNCINYNYRQFNNYKEFIL